MKQPLLLVAGIFISALSIGQEDQYQTKIQQAWKQYEDGKYCESAKSYSEGFATIEGKAYPNDRYNAACSFALCESVDSAYYHLFRVAEGAGYRNLKHITKDPDLDILRKDARWDKLIGIVKSNKEEYEKDLDPKLVTQLMFIHDEDQKYRGYIDSVEKAYGWKSDEMKALWKTINEKDSINLIAVTKIIDERGWLGPRIIGDEGNSTLFLVIQHADIETQKKYLPVMRKAVEKGDARGSSLALLEDRVALREGEMQIYGSQIGRNKDGVFYVCPLEDPDHVDERRAKVGLPPLATYVAHWDMKWDVEEYKKMLPKIKKWDKH